MKQIKSKEILTRKETSELLSVSFTTLNEWSKNGILPSCKAGNRTYYLRSDILQMLHESKGHV